MADHDRRNPHLLYMLGFSVDPLAASHMSDGPDVLASTPDGDLAVIECTTGALNNDGKLSKLLLRLNTAQDRLTSMGHKHARCVAVMVTTLHSEHLTDVQEATRKGIVVLTAEGLNSLLGRTKSTPDANRLFEEWWQQAQPVDSMQQELGEHVASSLLSQTRHTL
ncbi:hypothetical protein [Paraburkholderia phenoliruptrix]|uniref:hypothetical protein n=1 Tax=Paraburkholderia phenoliruptrix TaxID=252970 RepID=UPI0034CDDE86